MPMTTAMRANRNAALTQIIAALPKPMQQVIALRYSEGLHQREIGTVLNVPESRVRQIQRAAFGKLRQGLTQLGLDAA